MSSDRPVDFDALLQALGAADAEPPPLMKQLLAGVEQPSAPLSAADVAIIAELEAWLSALRDETPST